MRNMGGRGQEGNLVAVSVRDTRCMRLGVCVCEGGSRDMRLGWGCGGVLGAQTEHFR